MFKTELLTVKSLVERMLEEARIEKLRLESKLGSSTVTTFKSTQSVTEREEDKASWQTKLARAETDVENAAPGSLELKKAELERDELKLKLDKLTYAELSGGSDPQDVVEGAKSIKKTQALLDIEIAYIAELETRLGQFP